MTTQEARDAMQLAALKTRRQALTEATRKIAARQAARVRRQRQQRLIVVGHLVEAAGLLWVADDVLEQRLAEVAARLQDHPLQTSKRDYANVCDIG